MGFNFFLVVLIFFCVKICFFFFGFFFFGFFFFAFFAFLTFFFPFFAFFAFLTFFFAFFAFFAFPFPFLVPLAFFVAALFFLPLLFPIFLCFLSAAAALTVLILCSLATSAFTLTKYFALATFSNEVFFFNASRNLPSLLCFLNIANFFFKAALCPSFFMRYAINAFRRLARRS